MGNASSGSEAFRVAWHATGSDTAVLSTRRLAMPKQEPLFSVVRLFATLRLWVQRFRERRSLADLDDHLLGDLGLTRERVRLEAARPFWAGRERERLRGLPPQTKSGAEAPPFRAGCPAPYSAAVATWAAAAADAPPPRASSFRRLARTLESSEMRADLPRRPRR